MGKYTYDESGVTFFYFALTVLSLVVAPATLYMLAGNKDADSKAKAKTPKVRVRKTKTKSSVPQIKAGLILLGWLLIFVLSYKVKTTKIAEAESWNPFGILEVDDDASAEVIKKSFRKLSIKWHPDKVSQEMKEEAGVMMAELNRAYKALTDPVAYENYKKYGNPDGMQTQSMGIALPRILVEAHTSPFVLLLYGAVFGFLMPFYVGRWWYNSTRYQKDGILNPTMGTFFKNIREHISQRNLIELLTAASEFSEDDLKYRESEEAALNAISEKVQRVSRRHALELFNKSKKFTGKDAWKANVLLHAHFFRVTIDDADLADQQQQMVGIALKLVHRGLIQISTTHMWFNCSILLMNISQMLVQGVYSHDAPIIQLPGVTWENQPKISKDNGLYSVNQLMRMSSAEQRQALSILSDKQFEETLQYAKMIPRIEVPRVLLTVVGDKVITKESFVTLIVKLRIANTKGKAASSRSSGSPIMDIEHIADEDTVAIEQFTTTQDKAQSKQVPPEVLCPYFAGRKDAQWWMCFANYQSGKLVVPPILISDLATERVMMVQFQSPPQVGTYRFQLIIKSDSYIGSDIMQDVTMTVVDRSALPPEPPIDDYISEPEADSIAGQMAQMRGQQTTTRRGDSDSSDEE
ncbi:secretory subunit [Coemansia sp. Benny D115]|nr:secretory subunit [Coemansia sp. Benny D115]